MWVAPRCRPQTGDERFPVSRFQLRWPLGYQVRDLQRFLRYFSGRESGMNHPRQCLIIVTYEGHKLSEASVLRLAMRLLLYSVHSTVPCGEGELGLLALCRFHPGIRPERRADTRATKRVARSWPVADIRATAAPARFEREPGAAAHCLVAIGLL